MDCSILRKACNQRQPHMDRHHKWWPKHWYRTPLEQAFRSDPRNIDDICRCAHNLEHLKRPPQKPTVAFMRRFLGKDEP